MFDVEGEGVQPSAGAEVQKGSGLWIENPELKNLYEALNRVVRSEATKTRSFGELSFHYLGTN